MNEPFKVGTICIGQNFTFRTNAMYNGMECEIHAGLEMRQWCYLPTGQTGTSLCYVVIWANGNKHHIFPSQLRRKPPTDSQWADEAVRKLKKQSSDHVVIGKPELIPEETA